MKLINRNNKIKKSKEIIKQEKAKIRLEKKKQKEEKTKKFYKTKIGKFIKKIFLLNNQTTETQSIKSQILSNLYFEIVGFLLCLLVLFALSGGRNYLKLYKELQKLINVYDTITNNYYGDLDKDKLIDNAIDTMVSETGDTYTTYTNEEDTKSFLETVDGTYEGIGCMVTMDENNNILVANIFDNSPAKKAGLQVNDIIIKVDGQDYTNKTSNDMSEYIKSSTAKSIILTIKRNDKEKEITIKRNNIEVPTVTSKVIKNDNKKIGYIDISVFSSVTYKQFNKQLKKLEKKGIKALIIDVRDDSGGYLTSVTDISSIFLKKGQTIYQLEDNNKTEKIKDKTSEKRTYPIAVLVNATSASASEILASTIKESYGGLVVGTRTYGKGTVQKTKKLSDGSMVKYTVQKWLTPDGNWINETGVEPTDFVELDKNVSEDNQIETAVNLLIEKIK